MNLVLRKNFVAATQANVKNEIEILTAPQVTIGSYIRDGLSDDVIVFVCEEIESLTRFFKSFHKLERQDIVDISRVIVDKFSQLTIEDIKLFVKYAKLGKYGRANGKLDGELIVAWLDMYFGDRCDKAATLQLNQHKRIQKETYFSDEGVDVFRKLIKELGLNENMHIGQENVVAPSPEQKEFSRFVRQFNNLARSNRFGSKINNSYFVKINGRFMDVNEFLKYKYENRF